MARTMAERLSQARARGFVGRDRELVEFADLLRADDHAVVVVVHGPAGIGKTPRRGAQPRAYVSPAPTLERAAEVLVLPSSTFRRLLATAGGRVVTVLWHRELGA